MEWLPDLLKLDLAAVVPLVGFSAAAGWFDLRTGRIPNVLVKYLLLVTVVWLCLVVGAVGFLGVDTSLLRPYQTVQGYVLTVLRNGATAFLIGLALWLGRLWAAGDSKLFPLLVVLLPLRFYSGRWVDAFPGFVLFYNFVLATIAVIVLDFLWQMVRGIARRLRQPNTATTEERPPVLARILAYTREHVLDWVRFALLLIMAFMFIRLLRHFFRDAIEAFIHFDETIVYVLLFFMTHPIIRFMRHNWAFIGAIVINLVFLGLAMFELIPGLTVGGMLTMSGMAFGLILFRMLYDNYQRRVDFVEIDVEDLAPKMLLSDQLCTELRVDRGYFREQGSELGTLLPDGLQPPQVPLVQRWLRERRPGERVQVQKTFPMAPCMLIGVVLTLLLNDYALRLPR